MEIPTTLDGPAHLHELLARRWSPRAFAPGRQLAAEAVTALFEAARWAPSSFNAQPWRYRYAAHGGTGFETLRDLLTPHNQAWAQHASLLVLGLVQTRVQGRDQPNAYAQYDLGGANAALTVQATALGLHVHQMAGFDKARAQASFALPPDWEAVVMLAIGYRSSPEQLPEPLRRREMAPRERLPLAELIAEV